MARNKKPDKTTTSILLGIDYFTKELKSN